MSQELYITWPFSEATPRLPVFNIHGRYGYCWHDGYIANETHVFDAGSNSEESISQKLVSLIDKYGAIQAAQKIAGPFSWVVWNSTTRELLVCTDRLGLRPIYYAKKRDAIHLSSDIRRLIRESEVELRPNREALASCASLMGAPPGQTYYKDVECFPPATVTVIQNSRFQTQPYWDFQLSRSEHKPDETYEQEYLSLLTKVVEGHTSNESNGLTISSGLDSNSIAAAARLAFPQRTLHALSWSFPENPDADETRYAAEISSRLKFEFSYFDGDFASPLGNLDSFLDSPIQPHITYYPDLWNGLFRLAQQKGVKTLLTGTSGDLLFGAQITPYPNFLLTGRWLELYRQIQNHLSVATAAHPLRKILLQFLVMPILGYFSTPKSFDSPNWLNSDYKTSNTQVRRAVFSPVSLPMLPSAKERLHALQLCGIAARSGQPGRAAAARYGVDLRQPFYDHRLIDFALSLPPEQTYRAGWDKSIVRRALRYHLPDSVIKMRNKIHLGKFGIVGIRREAQGKLSPLLCDMRLAEMGIVDIKKLRAAYQDFIDQKSNDTRFMITLILEAWLRKWFN